tara:strand:- start:8082 stop:8429 length:348 start_codon:yes stop_codon:yes gene_type:complete
MCRLIFIIIKGDNMFFKKSEENAEAKESEGATVAKASLPINIPKPTHRECNSLLGYEAGYFMGRQANLNTFDDEGSSGSEDELIFPIDDVIVDGKKLDNHAASSPKSILEDPTFK